MNVSHQVRVGFWMRSKRILKGVSLCVPSKGIYGFLGANGAGKTTLIHLICGIKRATAGTVQIFGQSSQKSEARRHIGYLPERPYFYEHLTGEELLFYFGRLSGLSERSMRLRVPEVLGTVGLSGAARTGLRNYSKGMLQRIGIAQAILHDPKLLILDEPMSGLDPLGRKQIRLLLKDLAAQGKVVFFSTHVVSDAEAICDHAAIITKGEIIGAGTLSALLADPRSLGSTGSPSTPLEPTLENWFSTEETGLTAQYGRGGK